VAVLITRATHWAVTTVHQVREVTAIPYQIKQLVIFAHVVFSLSLLTEPVFSAVEGVGEVTIFASLTEFSVASTVWGDCRGKGWWLRWWGDTVVVTFITDGTISAINQIVPVAATVGQIVELVIRAHMMRADAMRYTLPVLPAVVRVGKESISRRLAVHHGATVLGGGSLGGGVAVAFVSAGPVSTINIKRIGAPLKGNIITVVIFTLLMGETAPVALIVVGAGIWVWIIL